MYPQSTDKFTTKLNKVDGNTYVIEEEVFLTNGVYEDFLEHDNVTNSSVRVFTGSKLTGEKVENFILSTPSMSPWKKSIKVFSKAPKVYITYETQGDTVEAEDINIVQESIVNTQKSLNDEIARSRDSEKVLTDSLNAEVKRAIEAEQRLDSNINFYKESNNEEVQKLRNKDSDLDNKKTDKTYVDIELNKRYLKEQVFTKEEVLQKIKDVIGTAPQALDTLKEIAKALNNDSDFAGTITNKLSEKVDKIPGKQLSTEDYTNVEKQKLSGIEEKANNYIHPQTHEANMIIEDTNKRFVSDNDKNTWNESYNKRHEHNNLTLLETITQALINGWNSAVNHISDNIRHISKDERDRWNNKVDSKQLPTKLGQLENDKKYVTKDELGDAGYGDMVKAIYDKNSNGKVDIAEVAESIEWSNVKNKPSVYVKKESLTWDNLKGV